jgi:single-strand DNA-binding protein
MPYENIHRVMGHLGRDPEIRKTGNGNSVCNLSIATSHRPRKGAEMETTWHRVTVWGNEAEWIARDGRKGDLVLAEGRVEERTYTDRDGNERTSREIVCGGFGSRCSWLRRRGHKAEGGDAPATDYGNAGRDEPTPDLIDEEIPF